MKIKNYQDFVIKIFAITSIYLIVSLIFYSSNALALLEYDISGKSGQDIYTRPGSVETINVQSETAASLTNSKTNQNIPLECTPAGGLNTCTGQIEIPNNFNPQESKVQFKITQVSGTPLEKTATLTIDSMPPNITITDQRVNEGIQFSYEVKDYLQSQNENSCIGSGIKKIVLNINSKAVDTIQFNTKNCTYVGTYFYNMSQNYGPSLTYSMSAYDDAGNFYLTNAKSINGDFKPPQISDTFKILKSGVEITKISSSNDIVADIVFTVEDSNLSSNVYGDLSSLNLNPAISYPYKNIMAICKLDNSRTVNTCRFSNIKIKPGTEDLSITVSAYDSSGNYQTKSLKNIVELKNSPGKVLYLGPSKNQCNQDLSVCYTKKGTQLFYTEIDATSDYSKSLLNIIINGDNTFAVCKLNSTWNCVSNYNVNKSSGEGISMYVGANSYDTYGNRIESDMQTTILVDSIAPKNVTSLISDNICPISGEELNLQVNIQEIDSEDLTIYVNSSSFSSQKLQGGTCERQTSDEWNCILTLKSFVSSYVPKHNVPITISDLAGNELTIPYTFEVCQSNSNSNPNEISSIVAKSENIRMDQKTMSIMPIRLMIPLDVQKKSSSTQIYDLSVDRCSATSTDGQELVATRGYVSDFSNPVLMIDVGGKVASIPENLNVNCTVSAKVRSGNFVFLVAEQEKFSFNIKTFNQPLGTVDSGTYNKIIADKKRVKELEESIKSYESVEKIFGTMCNIADTIVKVNGVLQTLKAILYGVSLILAPIGVGEVVWKASIVPTKFDQFTQDYVWPTGVDTTNPTGYIIKYSCILYTCQLYTFQGMFNTVMDAVTLSDKIHNDRAGKTIVTEENGVRTEKRYDLEGELIGTTVSKKDDKGNILSTENYDTNDNLITKTNFKSQGGYTTYDSSGNILEDAASDGSFVIYDRDKNTMTSYDSNSGELQVQSTDSSGRATGVISKNYDDPKKQYEYDLEQYNLKYAAALSAPTNGLTRDDYMKSWKQSNVAPTPPPGYGVNSPSVATSSTTSSDDIDNVQSTVSQNEGLSFDFSQREGTNSGHEKFTSGGKVYAYNSEDGVYYSDDKQFAYDPKGKILYENIGGNTWKEMSGPNSNFGTSASNAFFSQAPIFSALGVDIYETPSSINHNGKILERDNSVFSKDGGGVIYTDSSDGKYYSLRTSNDGSIQTLIPIDSKDTYKLASISVMGSGSGWASTAQSALMNGALMGQGKTIGSEMMRIFSGRNIMSSPLNRELLSASTKQLPSGAKLIGGVRSGGNYLPPQTTKFIPKGGSIWDVLVVYEPPITGKVVDPPGGLIQAGIDYGEGVSQRDARFYSELSSHKWVINPYKSWYYDDLCAPAVLYNMQKERQLKCMKIKCMQTQLEAGLPVDGCEKREQFYTCLYLDSAEYKMSDEIFTSVIIPGLIKSGVAFATNVGLQWGYSKICSSYKGGMSSESLVKSFGFETSLANGAYAVGCGLLGAFLQSNEIKTIFSPSKWKNYFGSERPQDPAKEMDYCKGLDLEVET